MAKQDPEARKANAELRASFGRTPEVAKAIKRTREIRAMSSTDIDYAATLASMYSQIIGGKRETPSD